MECPIRPGIRSGRDRLPNNVTIPPLLLVGCGAMALHYAKVLQVLGVPFQAIGRSIDVCAKFAAQTGTQPMPGGLAEGLRILNGVSQSAIVAVTVDQLTGVTQQLLGHGVRRILVEKPAGLNTAEIRATAQLAASKGADVFVAYNRRFYASTARAREIIQSDGGATSFHFEFTEWSHQIEPLPTPAHVKRRWFLANSTHVCDLAFFLCGFPAEFSAYSGGSLAWHPAGSRFVGCGISEAGVLFSYHSNWESAGRWGIEICTSKRRLYLRPLEALSEQLRGQLAQVPLALEDQHDKTFKPGLYEQTRQFLEGRFVDLLRLEDHANIAASVYDRIVSDSGVAPHA